MNILIVRTYVLLTLLLTITSCNDKREDTLRLAHVSWPGFEALSLAKNRNLYKNLNVKTYRPDSNGQVILAFKNNLVDVIALTLTHAIEIQSESDEQIMIFSALDVSHGGDVIIAKKEIKSLKELVGKRVGMEPTAFGAFFISRAIDFSDELSINQMHIVPVTIENHTKTFLENEVDAIVTYEPSKSKILKQKGHILFDSSQIPNEIIDVLVTKTSFAKKHPQALIKLLNGYFKALDTLKKHPEKAITEMAEYEGISSEEFKLSLAGIQIPERNQNRNLFRGENPKILSTMKMLQKFMISKNIISKKNMRLPEISDQFLSN